MGERKRFRLTSAITRELLRSGEGQLVDFKRVPESISSDDFVAFANTAEGGTILAGIGEQNVGGAQVGVILGCDVSDNTMLQLLNKAISCMPPIAIDIFIENLDEKPILRVSVPSSPTKPHCTPKGLYCRRDGARNRALQPGELIRIFLETESQAFATRFEAAASRISQELDSLEQSLSGTIRNMSDQLGWAGSNLDDTSSTIDNIFAYTKHLNDEITDVATRVRALFRQDKREDPVRDREFRKLTQQIVDQVSNDQDLVKAALAGNSLSCKLEGKPARELVESDVQAAFEEATEIIRKREDLKNYSVFSDSPAKLSEGSIDAIAALIADGHDPAPFREEIISAFRIGYTTYKDKIVAVAGLRKPRSAARAILFKRIRSSSDSRKYKVQLDWIFLHEDHRKKGQFSRLFKSILASTRETHLFAVLKKNDVLSREILLSLGFRPDNSTESLIGKEISEQIFLIDIAQSSRRSG